MAWKQAYNGPFSKKEAQEHAAGILKSAKTSPYMSQKQKDLFKTTYKKTKKGWQVYFWDE